MTGEAHQPLEPAGWLQGVRDIIGETGALTGPVQEPEIALRIYMSWNGTDPSDNTEGKERANRESAIVNQIFRPDIEIQGFRVEIEYPEGSEAIYLDLEGFRGWKAQQRKGE